MWYYIGCKLNLDIILTIHQTGGNVKKIALFVIVFVCLFASVSSVFASGYSPISFGTLDEDSKYAGTYFGYFCISETRCSEDADQFTPWDLFLNKPHIHVTQLVGSRAYLSMDARSDYQWEWKDGSLFHDGAFYLVRKWYLSRLETSGFFVP